MNPQILDAIRQGGAEEIVNLFRLRAEAVQRCAELEASLPGNPALRDELKKQKKAIQTIDNYMKDKLQPVCKIDGEFILAFPDQCQLFNRIGIAPGNLDALETGQRFINPSLHGYIAWGVFDKNLDNYELMPAMAIQHFETDDIDVVQSLCFSYQHSE